MKKIVPLLGSAPDCTKDCDSSSLIGRCTKFVCAAGNPLMINDWQYN